MSTKGLLAYLPKEAKLEHFTRQEAIDFADSKEWYHWNDRELVAFQLYQEICCVPFEYFHAALERELGRGVYIHELGEKTNWRNIVNEFLGNRPAPSLHDIISLLPAEKVIILDMHKEDNNAH